MKFPRRYSRNQNTLSQEECLTLQKARVVVIGCGGLGGHIIEHLGRLGIGNITAVDDDVFDETNLNRQILSTESLIGKSKSLAAVERMKRINSEAKVNGIVCRVTKENAKEILGGHHMVIDALDNIQSRLILEDTCQELGIPLIHGAIGGWYGQVAVIMPGRPLLKKIYGEGQDKGLEEDLGNPSFTPGVIAGIQVAECVKVLLNKDGILKGQILTVDLQNLEFDIIDVEKLEEGRK
ncbi:MAG: HesA/MoeB/ThiF family protein [Anaerovoracaceae bacterium]|jgi:molybdopterin/thiamine biosynthesis adenylyltransferase|nr:HesA/MoeB/ThiF family protein [Anaerovoracaceae bacterium]